MRNPRGVACGHFTSTFQDFSLPRALDTCFYGLVRRTFFSIEIEGPFGLISCACRYLDPIIHMNPGNLQYAIDLFDTSVHIGDQITSRWNSPRVQRGAQCSNHSARYASHYVIKGGRVLRAGYLPAVLLLVEMLNPPVYAKVKGFFEAFHVCCSVGPLMFFNANFTGVGYRHFFYLLESLVL